jgi:hypothetical protein
VSSVPWRCDIPSVFRCEMRPLIWPSMLASSRITMKV